MQTIKIKQNKKKVFLLLIASIAFVIIGFAGALYPDEYVSTLYRNPSVIRISGIVGICFFGPAAILLCGKLFNNTPGLSIDENGITDNTNASSLGLIDWRDITHVEVRQIASTQIMILHTNMPEKYMERTGNIIARKAISMNYKMYGSPIIITPNTLKMDFDRLEDLIRSELEKRQH